MNILKWLARQFYLKSDSAITDTLNTDVLIISRIENILGRKISQADDISLADVGYSVNSVGKVTALSLQGLGLISLWEIYDLIEQLTHLKHLDVSGNNLKDLTPLKRVKALNTLLIHHNRLSDLSPLSELTTLTHLALANNNITDISAIKKLTNLTALWMDNNEITDISSLGRLTQLVILMTGRNKIKDITSLKNLTKLTRLLLDGNRIDDVSPLSELTNIEHLELDNNKITDISALKNLTKISRLTLTENPIEELPAWITDWGLEITWERFNNKNKAIIFYNNPFKNIPIEIIKQGKESIENYFKQLSEQAQDYLFEAKLLIIGEPGAGKTTMTWKIENPDSPLPNEDDTTRGIDVRQYYFPLKAEDIPSFQHPETLTNKQFRVNLWDFGGQEIYKATHRFFLSNRSLYALVADSRKEDTDFNYWLHIVEIFGGNSPLLIILNEKHNRKRDIDITAMKNRFTNIVEVLDIDFAEDNRTRLQRLNNAVRYYVSQLPHVGSLVPGKWTAVRAAIDNDNRNTITIQDYLNICRANGIKKLEDAMLLSRYFHEIGVFLHFQDDGLLNKTIFLKPNWATTAVYKILDHELLNQQQGRFNKEDAGTIWKEEEYILRRDELLRLMQKFYLTYEIEQTGKFIVPERLPIGQPEYHLDNTDNLYVKYEYDHFMPKGIMSQLIVQMYAHIKDHSLVWKRGVILEREETLAEIIESYDARFIRIRAVGKNKRDFLTIITNEIDKINSQYEKMKVQKMIPCNCSDCKGLQTPHFYRYKDLKRRLENGKLDIECEVRYMRVNIRSLIDEVLKEDPNEKVVVVHGEIPPDDEPNS